MDLSNTIGMRCRTRGLNSASEKEAHDGSETTVSSHHVRSPNVLVCASVTFQRSRDWQRQCRLARTSNACHCPPTSPTTATSNHDRATQHTGTYAQRNLEGTQDYAGEVDVGYRFRSIVLVAKGEVLTLRNLEEALPESYPVHREGVAAANNFAVSFCTRGVQP